LVPHDDERLFCPEGRARADDVLDQCASPRAVQYLREARFQPRAFSCGEDDDSEIMVGHGFSPFCGSLGDFAIAGCVRRGEYLISGRCRSKRG